MGGIAVGHARQGSQAYRSPDTRVRVVVAEYTGEVDIAADPAMGSPRGTVREPTDQEDGTWHVPLPGLLSVLQQIGCKGILMHPFPKSEWWHNVHCHTGTQAFLKGQQNKGLPLGYKFEVSTLQVSWMDSRHTLYYRHDFQ